jgi:hypothetical protein
MQLCRSNRRRIWSLVAGLGLVGLLPAAGQAQVYHSSKSDCAPPPCAAPLPQVAPAPGTPQVPTPPGTQPGTAGQAQPSVDLSGLQGTAGAEPGTESFAPNVIGDLLYTSRSVSFGFVRVNGVTDFFGLANTSIVNSSVDENNSPLPKDRLYFRYNLYSRAQAVTGLSPTVIPLTTQPTATFPPGSEFPGKQLPPALLQLPTTKHYDLDMYTFGAEKTFLDGQFSVEVRAPFFTSLASHNILSTGVPGGTTGVLDSAYGGPGNANFRVLSTPENTLGRDDTEWGNLTLVLKGLVYRNCDSGFSLSAGAGMTLPTGQDEHLTVVDYAAPPSDPFASSMRRQNIVIGNDTMSVSPFLAALWIPSKELFTQSFVSVEVPIGSSPITYLDQRFAIPGGGTTFAPFLSPVTAKRYIDEQTLLHLDWNIGYWIYRKPENSGLSGIAPCLEVHYTSTLDNVDRVQLPSDGSGQIVPVPLNQLPVPPEKLKLVTAPGPVVGGQRNRLDIVDLTVGTTFLFGQQTTLATAFTFPATETPNRTFDWEFQLQLNYYFGGSCRR